MFEPVRLSDVQVLATIRQKVHAVMAAHHPLAAKPTLRLRDCVEYAVALPTSPYGVRHLIDLAVVRSSVSLTVAIESDNFEFLRHYPARENLISFQIPIGLPVDEGQSNIVSRPLDTRDVPEGLLYVCQLKERTLPVAVAKFANQIERSLIERFDLGVG